MVFELDIDNCDYACCKCRTSGIKVTVTKKEKQFHDFLLKAYAMLHMYQFTSRVIFRHISYSVEIVLDIEIYVIYMKCRWASHVFEPIDTCITELCTIEHSHTVLLI